MADTDRTDRLEEPGIGAPPLVVLAEDGVGMGEPCETFGGGPPRVVVPAEQHHARPQLRTRRHRHMIFRHASMEGMRRAILLLLLFVLPACSGSSSATPGTGSSSPTAEVVVRTDAGERSLSVRVADSEAERERGLMGVGDLPADDGMAFVFDGPVTSTFWMKDTQIPLSIAFSDEDGQILTITEMTPCRTDPCPTYAADGPYTMAVEANAGWFGANGVGVGTRRSCWSGRDDGLPALLGRTGDAVAPRGRRLLGRRLHGVRDARWSCGARTDCPTPSSRPGC